MNFKIKSITGTVHDTGFGGFPYKVIVNIEIDSKDYNKLKVTRKASSGMFGHVPAQRDLGPLVLDVNNTVYRLNENIPAHNPSIDSKGSKKAIKGVKSMEFVYFFSDHNKAEKLGYKILKYKSGEVFPIYNQNINLLPKV